MSYGNRAHKSFVKLFALCCEADKPVASCLKVGIALADTAQEFQKIANSEGWYYAMGKWHCPACRSALHTGWYSWSRDRHRLNDFERKLKEQAEKNSGGAGAKPLP
jgi:hypothetical protein